MASFDSVNYSLRPSKSIQRQLVFEGVRILQSHLDLDRLVYVGFGSIWFTDFVMAHKLLGIDDMVSIESNRIGFCRAVFNSPYATVRVREGISSNVLPTLYDDGVIARRPWMIWLDYDCEFNETIRDDTRSVIENVPANSILLITFNGNEMKYGQATDRPERLRFALYLNPMATLIEGYRDVLMYDRWPAWKPLAITMVISVVLFLIGRNLIRRFDHIYARSISG